MAEAYRQAHSVPARRNRYQHERDLVDGAVALVGSGAAARVSLVVQHATVVLRAAPAAASRRTVIVRAAWRPGRAACDVVVEPIV